MAQGIQVYDSAGTLVVDTSTLVYKEIYSEAITGDGTYVIPAEFSNYDVAVLVDDDTGNNGVDVAFDPDTNTAHWNVDGGGGSTSTTVRVALF